MKSFVRDKYWPIGLDIGADSIKMLQMQRVGRTIGVMACGQYRLSGNVPDSGPERRKIVVSGIREILRQAQFRGRKVISTLSSTQLHIKNVRIAQVSEKKLADTVRREASERFNFKVGPDQLRWINAGQVRQGTEMRDEIIMLAVSAETIDEHLAMLGEVGLVPEFIEAEPVALFRVFQHFLRRRADERFVSVIVDIGKSATRVTVARGPKIIFIKKIDIGGGKLTEAVAGQLNLNYEEAHDLRVRMMKEHGVSDERQRAEDKPGEDQARTSIDWTIHDAMRGEVEELSKEIALCLRYCSVTFRGLRSDCVVLTGGEAYDTAMVNLLTESLGVKCVVGRPLRGIDVSSMNVAANRRGTLAEWAVCTGLAVREANLENAVSEKDHTDAEHRLSA